MFLKLLGCWCIAFSFSGVQSQEDQNPPNSGYDTRFLNYWNSNNGYSSNNNRPIIGNNNNNNAASNFFSFNERPNDNKFFSNEKEKNFKWGAQTATNTDKTSDWNSNKQSEVNNDRQSNAFNNRPNKKKLNSNINTSKWNSNSNSFASSGYNSAKPSSNQNNKIPDIWNSNNVGNNKKNGNDIYSESEYEDNSVYSSWGSNNNNKIKPTSSSYGNFGGRESTTQKNNKNLGNSKWETNSNKEPQKTSGSNTWGVNNSSESTGEKSSSNSGQSSLNTSILDELDKNDWYFGKESNYPKPPFRSTLNIDVSELWNFDKNKNKKTNQNYRNNQNDSKNSRRNRQIERLTGRMGGVYCKCVSVNLCEEEDIIITQKDVNFELRPFEFTCERLTDVCCTNPKTEKITNEDRFREEKDQLQCGQTRMPENQFENYDDDEAEPGEFPWILRLENAEINCSASLIHPKVALTAAHCVTSAQPEELTIKSGVWEADDEPSQRRVVTKIIKHPDYSSRNPRNDIALLVLETPFVLKDNINTICLPKTNDRWDSNKCIIAGVISEEIQGQYSEVFEKEVVNFLPQSECQNIMLVTDLWRNYVLHDSFICGLGKTTRKSCTGNEGGFVICPFKNRPRTYLQIGIVSMGINCDNFGRPGIFTNVLIFLDWINKNLFELGLFD